MSFDCTPSGPGPESRSLPPGVSPGAPPKRVPRPPRERCAGARVPEAPAVDTGRPTDGAMLAPSPERLHEQAMRGFRLGNRGRLAMAQALLVLRETGGVQALGYPTVEAYAKDHFQWSRTRTREAVRVARALGELPRLLGALVSGGVSWSVLEEVTRVASPASELAWLRYVQGKDVGQVRAAVRKAREAGKDRPPGGTWGLPDVARRHTVRLSRVEEEKVHRAFGGILAELAESLGGPVGLRELLLYLAERELARPPEERGAGDVSGARYAVVYLACPRCGRAAAQTSWGPVEVSPGEVGRVLGEAEVVDATDAGMKEEEAAAGAGEQVPGAGGQVRNRATGPRDALSSGPGRGSSRKRAPVPVPDAAHRRVRRVVMLREGERCANPSCGRRAEHAHHVVPRAEGGPSTVANEVAVCGKCHALIHAGLLEVRVLRDGRLVFRPRCGVPVEERLRRAEREASRRLPVYRLETAGGPPATGPGRVAVADAPPSRPERRAGTRRIEDLAWGLRRLGVPGKEAVERVRWALCQVDPEDAADDAKVLVLAIRGPGEDRRR